MYTKIEQDCPRNIDESNISDAPASLFSKKKKNNTKIMLDQEQQLMIGNPNEGIALSTLTEKAR